MATLPLPARARTGQWLPVAVVAALAAGLLTMSWTGVSVGPSALERAGERFVTLSLELNQRYPDEVDGYFGPAALEPARPAPASSAEVLEQGIAALETDLASLPASPRQARLRERTARLAALADLLGSRAARSFDDEAHRLYGLDLATMDEQRFAEARADLERLLPGSAPLAERVRAFRERFVVREDLRPALFARALAECRARTLARWPLPSRERVDVEWTSAVGAAWHRYRGGYRSTLQVNPQAVAFLGSVTDVACHEGYPGHHAQFVLAEQAAGVLPVEDRLVLLRSPGSVLRESAADYAVGLVMPSAERLAFERDVLFPMAGFEPGLAERFGAVRTALDRLAPAALPILRDYRDRRLDPAAAAAALRDTALVASPEALLGFTDRYGAYVAGYTGVREQVRAVVDAGGATGTVRWMRLACLLRLADAAPLARIAHAARNQGAAGCALTNQGGTP